MFILNSYNFASTKRRGVKNEKKKNYFISTFNSLEDKYIYSYLILMYLCNRYLLFYVKIYVYIFFGLISEKCIFYTKFF